MNAVNGPMLHVMHQALSTVATEVQRPVLLQPSRGQIPAEVRGVLLRNGPGRQHRGGQFYGHPFDGDGFVQRFTFDDHGVHYLARFVQTQEFLAEEQADRILFRGFGTQRPGGARQNALDMRFKNAANTAIVHHAGRTLALWEGGLPHRLDPNSLATLGREDFDGALQNRFSWLDRKLNPELPFAAHPKLDPHTGELWSFGTAYGLKNRLLVHRVDPQGTLHTRSIAVGSLPFVHDMVLTERFAVFVLPAVSFDLAPVLFGKASPVDSLRIEDAPGTALIVPRDGSDPVRIEVPPGFVFHWAGGTEQGHTLVLEGVKYAGFPKLRPWAEMLGPAGAPELLARPVRLTLDVSTGTSHEEQLADIAMELPSAVGAGTERVIYGTAARPGRTQPYLSAIARLDADGGTVLRDFFPHLPGEPVFAGGHLLVPTYRYDHSSTLEILDAEGLRSVASIPLPHPVPPGLHGQWIPGTPK